MSVNVPEAGIHIAIDLGDFKRSLQAKEQLRVREGTDKSASADGAERAPKLVEQIPDKGRLLDLIA